MQSNQLPLNKDATPARYLQLDKQQSETSGNNKSIKYSDFQSSQKALGFRPSGQTAKPSELLNGNVPNPF